MKKDKHAFKQKESDNVVQTPALQFVSDCTPFMFSRNLRRILLDYISQNKDCLPVWKYQPFKSQTAIFI